MAYTPGGREADRGFDPWVNITGLHKLSAATGRDAGYAVYIFVFPVKTCTCKSEVTLDSILYVADLKPLSDLQASDIMSSLVKVSLAMRYPTVISQVPGSCLVTVAGH